MYRLAPRPLTLVFPTRALPLKDDSAIASRSETVPLLLIGAARQCTGASKSPSET